jgi:hypothetical protein
MSEEITSEKLQSVMSKIAALLKFNKDNATEDEAASAAAMVQKLLMTYNLELSEIITEKKQEGIEKDIITTRPDKWQRQLFWLLAKYNFCRVIGDGDDDTKLYLFGLKHNRTIVTQLFFAVANQLTILARMHYAEYTGKSSRHLWRKSFFKGAIDTILDRLETMKEEMALIVVTDRDLDLAVAEEFGRTYTARSRKVALDASGFHSGREAGNMVNFNSALK